MDYTTVEQYVSRLEVGEALSDTIDGFDSKVEETYNNLVEYVEDEFPESLASDFMEEIETGNYGEALELVEEKPSREDFALH